ncbi:hypothetical protein DFJ74DRAFT_655991 [Hyaloraphidium curvatum]|nr:hypothetical protein DFJ74DRAFT_655991 [Hyaloraphidium curvatum]
MAFPRAPPNEGPPSFALPPCRLRPDYIHHTECMCPECFCSCEKNHGLAVKLCRVSFAFYELARRRIWSCVGIDWSGKRLQTLVNGLNKKGTKGRSHPIAESRMFFFRPMEGKAPDKELITKVLPRFEVLTNLDIPFCAFDGSRFKSKALESLTTLRLLGPFSGPRLTVRAFRRMPALTSLTISGSPVGFTEKLSDDLTANIPEKVDDLYLGPFYSENTHPSTIEIPFFDRHLKSVTERLRNLTMLAVRNCVTLTDEALGDALEKFHSLEVLDLGYCYAVTDIGFGRLSTSKLRMLFLDGAVNLTDESVVPALEKNTGLVELKLNATRISDRSVAAIGKHLPRLVNLRLGETDISSPALRDLFSTPRPYEVLDFILVDGLDDDVVRAMAGSVHALRIVLLTDNANLRRVDTLLYLVSRFRDTLEELFVHLEIADDYFVEDVKRLTLGRCKVYR